MFYLISSKQMALRNFSKPIGTAEYILQFPEKEIKEWINREIEVFSEKQ